MIKPAFSTVACPDWTLDRVADAAIGAGFEAVELRTFGVDSREFACDPAMTDEAKVRSLFNEQGVEVLSLGTGLTFDAVHPVLSREPEREHHAACRMVDLAVALGCPTIRVFGFEYPQRLGRRRGIRLVAERLQRLADHAEKFGVRIAVENGGSFPTGESLSELLAYADRALVGGCLNMATSHAAGESTGDAVAALGSRILIARLKDRDASGRPVPLGEGELPCAGFVAALVEAGFDGPLVFEWDRAWRGELAPAAEVLPPAARTMFGWIAAAMNAAPRVVEVAPLPAPAAS